MKAILILVLILAPVPKELFKHPIPKVSDLKTASNRDLHYWASEIYLFKQAVDWAESTDGGDMPIDSKLRELYLAGGGYGSSDPEVSRYWLLKCIRENAGGRKSEVDPDD